MDKRPYVIAAVISVASLAVAAGAVVSGRKQVAAASGKEETASCGMPLGKALASKLPEGTMLLPPAENAEFKGSAVCGKCKWGIGEFCNTMLWDKEGHHVVALLPNERLTELQKLTGT